jgi:hypothetical protein
MANELPPTIANAVELTKRQLLELANQLANAGQLFATNAALDVGQLAARQVHIHLPDAATHRRAGNPQEFDLSPPLAGSLQGRCKVP